MSFEIKFVLKNLYSKIFLLNNIPFFFFTVEVIWINANTEIDILTTTKDQTNGCDLVKKHSGLCMNYICVRRCTNDGYIAGECTQNGEHILKKCFCTKEGCNTRSRNSNVSPLTAPVDSSLEVAPPSNGVPSSGR